MNTSELVEKVAKTSNISKAQAKTVVQNTLTAIQDTVKRGQDVSIVGFGTFKKGRRKARTGRNPQTGEAIKIAARAYPKFKPGLAFKNLVN